MTYVSIAPEHYLNVEPMIWALKFQPSDFEQDHGSLLHVPSRHRFKFDARGRVSVDAQCGCARRSVSAEQGDRLFEGYNSWRELYWQPLETDREFASHFAKSNAWVRLFRDIRMAWRRFRRYEDPMIVGETMLTTPAE
jgi:hypothetical protein